MKPSQRKWPSALGWSHFKETLYLENPLQRRRNPLGGLGGQDFRIQASVTPEIEAQDRSM